MRLVREAGFEQIGRSEQIERRGAKLRRFGGRCVTSKTSSAKTSVTPSINLKGCGYSEPPLKRCAVAMLTRIWYVWDGGWGLIWRLGVRGLGVGESVARSGYGLAY